MICTIVVLFNDTNLLQPEMDCIHKCEERIFNLGIISRDEAKRRLNQLISGTMRTEGVSIFARDVIASLFQCKQAAHWKLNVPRKVACDFPGHIQLYGLDCR